MRLSKVHVTNFRSVEDSGEFDVGQVLALVGKNEAGKTAILQALAGLNPHVSDHLNLYFFEGSPENINISASAP
ncbi:MAG: hypothetical protein DMG54_18150 [Acidobacteria bacterium]|nr:MAG: hypothetical protein AUG83_00670 [Acidobacteria bacterium 13_1_20CM_4_57_11]PYU41877.1 MAG: hypothetical protein DMG54_18150 [Acidobacteriota bacterium]PYU70652.1 MAG: hypothetical protein DMG52_24945 [Acidobacteriota bacterium]